MYPGGMLEMRMSLVRMDVWMLISTLISNNKVYHMKGIENINVMEMRLD